MVATDKDVGPPFPRPVEQADNAVNVLRRTLVAVALIPSAPVLGCVKWFDIGIESEGQNALRSCWHTYIEGPTPGGWESFSTAITYLVRTAETF